MIERHVPFLVTLLDNLVSARYQSVLALGRSPYTQEVALFPRRASSSDLRGFHATSKI